MHEMCLEFLDLASTRLACSFFCVGSPWFDWVALAPHCYLQLSSASVVDGFLCWFLGVAGPALSSLFKLYAAANAAGARLSMERRRAAVCRTREPGHNSQALGRCRAGTSPRQFQQQAALRADVIAASPMETRCSSSRACWLESALCACARSWVGSVQIGALPRTVACRRHVCGFGKARSG